MLEVHQEALEHLAHLLAQGSPESAIRIAVMGGGGPCSGLGLIIDEAREEDVSIQHATIPFIIDRSLLEYCETITIGFKTGRHGTCGGDGGFLLMPKNPL